MTTVRIPVRIRLDVDPARPAETLAGLLRDATEQATSRAAERARRVPAVRDGNWDDGPPATTVRFTGDPLPPALATGLAVATRTGLHVATTGLQAATAGGPAAKAPVRSPRKLRLRDFADEAEVWGAVVAFYGGAPPSELLVIARLNGHPRQWVVEFTTPDGPPLVRAGGPFTAFTRDGSGERPAGGLAADGLRFWRRFTTEAQWHAVLAELITEDLAWLRKSVPARELADRALAAARKFPFTGGGAWYEFLDGATRVGWYRGPAGLTAGTLPVAVLTEEVRPVGYGKDCAPLDVTSDGEAELGKPYLGEPPLDDWAADRDHFAALIRDIAARLEMPEGDYVGSFVLVATQEIGRRSERLGVLGGGTRARQAELRRLAQATVLATNLAAAYVDAMYSRDRAQTLRCPLSGHSGQWAFHFHQLFFRVRRDTVAQLFASACQDVLLEVLEQSLLELDRRLDRTNFPQYMRFTRTLLVIVLSRSVELEDLRRRIGAVRARDRNPALSWRAPNLVRSGWREASAEVVAALHDAASASRPAGAVVLFDGEYWAKDAHGHWWNDDQLALAIGSARQEAFLIDPFLEKIKDLSDVVTRLKDAQRRDDARSEQQGDAVTEAVDAEFSAVLAEVRRENVERTARVRQDRSIAFGLASFTEDRSDEIGARLTGIHRKADLRLRPMFDYEAVYVDALHALADAELGKAELAEFFNLAGLTFLAVFCPPAAFLTGAGQAIGALATAYEHRGIQRALLGGDEIITRAQAEAELWAAWIGAAIAFLPLVKPAARGLSGVARLALPGAERRAAAIAAIRLAKAEAAQVFALVTAEDLLGAFLHEAVKGYVLNLVLSSAIERFIDAVVSEDPHGEVSREHLRAVMAEAARAAGAGQGTP